MDENQDRATVLTSPDGEASLLVVADGLGGHSGAALAAQTAVDAAANLWAGYRSSDNPEEFLRSLVIKAHAAVNESGLAESCEPRTTLAALLVSGSQAFSVHAGDSRVMQISSGGLVRQTLDHSVGRLNVLSGAITEQELASHPDQRKLFSHLGGEEGPEFDVSKWAVRSGCRFVVCSDGFWEIFPVNEVQALFDAPQPLQALSREFRQKLSSLERHDNTTVILAELDPGPRPLWYFALIAPLTIAGLCVALWPAGGSIQQRPPVENPGNVEEPFRVPDESPVLRQIRNEHQRMELSALSGFAAQVGNGESGQVATEGAESTDGIRNERVNLRPDLVLEAGESVLNAVERELRKSGRLGAHDALQSRGDSKALGNRENARFQQLHRGVPVFATEIVVTSDGRRVVSILGHTAPAIDIDATPENSYEETVELTRKAMQSTLQTIGEGSLVILALEDSHRLGWLGTVSVDGVQQHVILDAETGEILYREPAVIG